MVKWAYKRGKWAYKRGGEQEATELEAKPGENVL